MAEEHKKPTPRLKQLYIRVPVKFEDYENVQGTYYEGTTEIDNSLDSEVIIFRLQPREVYILLLKYMGYNSKEIVELMSLKNVQEYYYLTNSLKINFKKLMKIGENQL